MKHTLPPYLYSLIAGRWLPHRQHAALAPAFVVPRLSATLQVLVALIWLVPDRRMEKSIAT